MKHKFESIYILLNEASKEFDEPSDIVSALKEGVITAYGIYFSPDDEELGKSQNLEPVKIAVNAWLTDTTKINIKENTVIVEHSHKGHTDIEFYNDVKLKKDEFEAFVNNNKLNQVGKNIQAVVDDASQSLPARPKNTEQKEWERFCNILKDFDKISIEEKLIENKKFTITRKDVACILYNSRLLTVAESSIEKNYMKHPYFKGKFSRGRAKNSKRKDFTTVISKLKRP